MTTQADIERALDQLAKMVGDGDLCADAVAPLWEWLERATPVETTADRIKARATLVSQKPISPP